MRTTIHNHLRGQNGYLLIVGEKEEAEGLVSVRAQGEGDKGQMTLEGFRDFIAGMVKEEIEANKMEKK